MVPAPRDGPEERVKATLLGRFSLRTSGRADDVHLPHKAQQLLAYLLLHRDRGHHRETLAETLWSAPGGDARKQLRQTLWVLQGHLEGRIPGGRLVDPSGEWISLIAGADVWVDLWAFEEEAQSLLESGALLSVDDGLPRAVAAERLYEGHLLEGWTEPWCREPRERALRLYALLLDALLGAYEAGRDPTKVMLYATRALAADPLRESAHRALIRALHELGDRSGALRQFQRCAEALRSGLGVEPSAETIALAERVRVEPGRALRTGPEERRVGG